jgi:peptidyl-prolyl cis-trans isomerase SurA
METGKNPPKKLKKIFNIIIIFFCLFNISNGNEVKIKVKIDNEIITNIDIVNEKNYLIFLNPSLIELTIDTQNSIAKNSLIKEIIKKKELIKYFDISKDYSFINRIEKNLYEQKNFLNKDEYINFLNNNNLNYSLIREKLKLEALWNQLIFNKYSKSLKIDENLLKKRITMEFENSKSKYQYNLSEILFEDGLNNNFEKAFQKIKNSIESIGFENTATIYGISDSAKNGGLIGWVNGTQIAEEIRKKINSIIIGEISKPIKIPNGYLILKLNDKKEIKVKLDLKKELDKLINIEKTKQLNNFSIIFYKRLKQNIIINEY